MPLPKARCSRCNTELWDSGEQTKTNPPRRVLKCICGNIQEETVPMPERWDDYVKRITEMQARARDH
jgi:hypothetical protein